MEKVVTLVFKLGSFSCKSTSINSQENLKGNCPSVSQYKDLTNFIPSTQPRPLSLSRPLSPLLPHNNNNNNNNNNGAYVQASS